jgi:hypothetical protein
VIPSTLRRKRPYSFNQEAYRRRNLIERMFCRMKTGGASQLDMTVLRETISQLSPSSPSSASAITE